MTLTDIARICHAANAELCLINGDDTQLPWSEASQGIRDSALAGVEYRAANPDGSPQAQHDAWTWHKRAAGWVYGEVKDEAAKTHPCLIDYDALPPHQRAKDALFIGICDALLPLAQPPAA